MRPRDLNSLLLGTGAALVLLGWAAWISAPGPGAPSPEAAQSLEETPPAEPGPAALAGAPAAAPEESAGHPVPGEQPEEAPVESIAAPGDDARGEPLAPDFREIAAALERQAGSRQALADQLTETLAQVNWLDPLQADTMASVLVSLADRHPFAAEMAGAFVEREAFNMLALHPQEPRIARNLMDAYFSIVSDPRLRGEFLAGLRKECSDPSSLGLPASEPL